MTLNAMVLCAHLQWYLVEIPDCCQLDKSSGVMVSSNALVASQVSGDIACMVVRPFWLPCKSLCTQLYTCYTCYSCNTCGFSAIWWHSTHGATILNSTQIALLHLLHLQHLWHIRYLVTWHSTHGATTLDATQIALLHWWHSTRGATILNTIQIALLHWWHSTHGATILTTIQIALLHLQHLCHLRYLVT